MNKYALPLLLLIFVLFINYGYAQETITFDDLKKPVKDPNQPVMPEYFINCRVAGPDRIFFNPPNGKQGFIAEYILKGSKTPFASYLFLPWQDLYLQDRDEQTLLTGSGELLTVTESAIVYKLPLQKGHAHDQHAEVYALTHLEDVLGISSCRTLVSSNSGGADTNGMAVIRIHSYPYYSKFEMAIPGSVKPTHELISESFPEQMVLLHQLPEKGKTLVSWVCTAKNDHNSDFGKLRQNFCPMMEKPKENQTVSEEIFGDHDPKTTPDNLLDYDPSLAGAVASIPDAGKDKLAELVLLFQDYEANASNDKGKWVDGNPALGAPEKEYRPSYSELLLAETGNRIQKTVKDLTRGEISKALEGSDDHPDMLSYQSFTFVHFDVVGSGRFTYVDQITDEFVKLK